MIKDSQTVYLFQSGLIRFAIHGCCDFHCFDWTKARHVRNNTRRCLQLFCSCI